MIEIWQIAHEPDMNRVRSGETAAQALFKRHSTA